MAHIKIRAHVYNPSGDASQTSRIQIRPGSHLPSPQPTLPYAIDNSNVTFNEPRYDVRTVECFDGYVDRSQLTNLVISGASGAIGEPNNANPRYGKDYKMNILSKYLRMLDRRNTAVLIISGQGSNSVSAYDVYRPLIATQNNAYYTPLPLNEYADFLVQEYDKYCETRHLCSNPDMIKVIINMMADSNRNSNNIFSSVEELQNSIESSRNQGSITESYATYANQILRNSMGDFGIARGFLSHYCALLRDMLYPVFGNNSGYNSRILNIGYGFQINLRTISSSVISDTENIEYNKTISRMLHADLSMNFNTVTPLLPNIIVILDHLSYEQAELFSWIWNSDSSWLKHQERLFIICLQEDYPKQMMRCTDFDGKIQKWYYLNHNDGSDLEALLGETLVFNTSTAQHIDYGGIISINRILKIPTGQGTHTVPTYRPKHSRTFFQELSPGEGLLKIRGQEKGHQFRCM